MLNPDTWKQQWEAFVSAPYIMLPQIAVGGFDRRCALRRLLQRGVEHAQIVIGAAVAPVCIEPCFEGFRRVRAESTSGFRASQRAASSRCSSVGSSSGFIASPRPRRRGEASASARLPKASHP